MAIKKQVENASPKDNLGREQ